MKNNRDGKILEVLSTSGGCTNKKLSTICEVSYKTIQNEIKSINSKLKQNGYHSEIVSQSGIGTVFKLYPNESLDKIMSLFQSDDESEYDKTKYSLLIAVELLRHNYLKIDDICEKYALSRSVIVEILSESRELLKSYDISVNSKPHYGLYASGKERDIRNFLFDKILASNDEEIKSLNHVSSNLEMIESIVVLIKNYNISISDSLLEQLVIFIEVMANRIRKGHYLDNENDVIDANSFEYILAEKISEEVSREFDIRININELGWLYNFIVGKCKNQQEVQGKVNSTEVEEFLQEIEQRLLEKYHYDFSKDLEFYSSMSIHLASLIKRARNHNYSFNPMMDQIKHYSILAYDMAVDASLILNEKLKVTIPDDEISFLSIYIHLAIERQKKATAKKKILVVCPTGRGMSELIAHSIRKQFGDYISILNTCGYYELEEIDFSQYDYLFTMKPLEIKVPIPVIEISLNESRYEIEKTKMKMQGKQLDELPLLCLTPKELFMNNVKGDSKQEVLKEIIGKISKTIPLADNFYESVMAREKIISTEMDYGFAIPHPLDRYMAEQSFFSIAILNKPVDWGRKKVRIVLLAYIDGEKSPDLELFYESYAALIMNQKYAMELIDDPSYECLCEIARDIRQFL